MTAFDLDNRGLSPPEPMVRILRQLAAMAPGDSLTVLMDREPMMLYSELERRGWTWTFEWHEDVGVLTIPAPAAS